MTAAPDGATARRSAARGVWQGNVMARHRSRRSHPPSRIRGRRRSFASWPTWRSPGRSRPRRRQAEANAAFQVCLSYGTPQKKTRASQRRSVVSSPSVPVWFGPHVRFSTGRALFRDKRGSDSAACDVNRNQCRLFQSARKIGVDRTQSDGRQSPVVPLRPRDSGSRGRSARPRRAECNKSLPIK